MFFWAEAPSASKVMQAERKINLRFLFIVPVN